MCLAKHSYEGLEPYKVGYENGVETMKKYVLILLKYAKENDKDIYDFVYENVEEVKEMPIYVKVEADKSNGVYSVTLCFEKDGQVFGVTTKAANVIKAVDTLKIYVVQIVTNGSFDGVL